MTQREALEIALAAKDQTIAALAEQVEWLRAELSASRPREPNRVPGVPQPEVFVPGPSLEPMYLDDDEEALVAQVEEGVITPEEFERKLAELQTLGKAPANNVIHLDDHRIKAE